MITFTPRQQWFAGVVLSVFHLLIITSSNYLVQLPVDIFGFHTTWGAFSFPFIFLATDLTVRIFGAPLARRIILLVMLPALGVSYVVSCFFYQGSWQGWDSLQHINVVVARIALASFMAYVLGQILDIYVFDRLRRLSRWWLAPAAAMFLGNISDTLAFFFIAFYHSSDAFMAQHWFEIALADYSYKIFICLVFFLPAYGVLLNAILKKMSGRTQQPAVSSG
ncbi:MULTISPECIES: 7-cyano-7-deazaguanine/7-aminomethyl-7-deazaguanine transporter [Tatumella]|uniref:Probable queuosine precursor transporter n=1 Tax=Tatumella punctata TaxID=399969 RepID=A0ABW1VMM5_9GAMM|nr:MULTISPECIES: 7-cyano-7-deazaguanine/7-aminomethyl-7-deazaguanine transporter [unclassified Tatumella]MBS0855654.1 7-cyano-7-deazaguanine/7-aminomethyl-7-deazaguanine transporter [Tatumella sp. JGM16]MBS0876635.1 7-cyano-7-deazaguanine/7-aminomethyl-7-deazaguanine transporter [Tatumella sp. JGM82]MBS0889978.1 7-cyano-7-deazaguanine/7-aminomethyl-7-deazaguanine transporter [Tatumella sp. JGM94]MBS0893160.1 7-cyano-7-deazaguanine/7-aminomethyl-7-deazaguanine transporter [Tatumella sp. JGM130]